MFMYKTVYIIQIVSKQLHRNTQENNTYRVSFNKQCKLVREHISKTAPMGGKFLQVIN